MATNNSKETKKFTTEPAKQQAQQNNDWTKMLQMMTMSNKMTDQQMAAFGLGRLLKQLWLNNKNKWLHPTGTQKNDASQIYNPEYDKEHGIDDTVVTPSVVPGMQMGKTPGDSTSVGQEIVKPSVAPGVTAEGKTPGGVLGEGPTVVDAATQEISQPENGLQGYISAANIYNLTPEQLQQLGITVK